MAPEQVPEVPMRRHVFDSERPFAAVLDGIFGGISQPDIEGAVQQARGQHLIRAIQLSPPAGAGQHRPDAVPAAGLRLGADPRSPGTGLGWAPPGPPDRRQPGHHGPDDPPRGRRRLYAPVTILIQQIPDGGTRVAYDTVASAIAPYHDAAASEVAQQLDTEMLDLLRQVTGVPASATP
jgi:hypothetical protein